MRAAQGLGIKTFALWRLGSEDRSLWRVWDAPGDSGATDKLKSVPPGQDVDMEGDGEILRIEARPADGKRSITVDALSGQITDENFDDLPEPYRVARYGASPNKVAITFDDGPDPQWTPKILDVLKREHAPATFFLIGIQADKYGDVASRIYSEGHEIGNHTFTHPDISNISPTFMRLELNLTEQLFASRLGMRTILFRPHTPWMLSPIPKTKCGRSKLPRTWATPRSATRSIPTTEGQSPPQRRADHRGRPCESAALCREQLLCAGGNIILLHDGGGNRAETVRALP